MSHLLRLTADLLVRISRDDRQGVDQLEQLALEIDVVADRLMRFVDSPADPEFGRGIA